jgi:hypothetical protein
MFKDILDALAALGDAWRASQLKDEAEALAALDDAEAKLTTAITSAIAKLRGDVRARVAKRIDDKFGPETMSAPAPSKPMTGLLGDDGEDAT